MPIRQDVAQMLLAGHSQREISQALHVGYRQVRTAREALGLPPRKPGPTAEAIEVTFARRTRATDDGHLIWDGHDLGIRSTDGAHSSAARYSFRRRYGRNPVGKVLPGCGVRHCVHPDHVEDQPMRQQYAAIFGGA
ncbi:hypothetical protein GTY86_35735 [Streptomyces sp. SID5770]|uniref:helix-turn-helix domain-containing protein n=1 Tax=Streptomyces sp. SID5770 TaxID=2690308 RepID=UPI001367BBD8|nr:helix-turn-helix domain-containing protein [Streptomyces sp. SID5770]MZE53783.1 hypothetical protein [Streptomyces sp. SID5770]MZE56528.1 hypothetical protein [Streptomyces sp. SID5770]